MGHWLDFTAALAMLGGGVPQYDGDDRRHGERRAFGIRHEISVMDILTALGLLGTITVSAVAFIIEVRIQEYRLEELRAELAQHREADKSALIDSIGIVVRLRADFEAHKSRHDEDINRISSHQLVNEEKIRVNDERTRRLEGNHR